MTEICANALEASLRSMARLSARRTRGSLNGFFSLLKTTIKLHAHGTFLHDGFVAQAI